MIEDPHLLFVRKAIVLCYNNADEDGGLRFIGKFANKLILWTSQKLKIERITKLIENRKRCKKTADQIENDIMHKADMLQEALSEREVNSKNQNVTYRVFVAFNKGDYSVEKVKESLEDYLPNEIILIPSDAFAKHKDNETIWRKWFDRGQFKNLKSATRSHTKNSNQSDLHSSLQVFQSTKYDIPTKVAMHYCFQNILADCVADQILNIISPKRNTLNRKKEDEKWSIHFCAGNGVDIIDAINLTNMPSMSSVSDVSSVDNVAANKKARPTRAVHEKSTQKLINTISKTLMLRAQNCSIIFNDGGNSQNKNGKTGRKRDLNLTENSTSNTTHNSIHDSAHDLTQNNVAIVYVGSYLKEEARKNQSDKVIEIRPCGVNERYIKYLSFLGKSC